MKVKVINPEEKSSSIWRYSRNLCNVDQENISVLDVYNEFNGINLIKREFKMEMDSYFGGVFLRKELDEEDYDILHYANQTISPIKTKKIQVVTVLDNPYVFLQSDVYSSFSATENNFKKHMKHNIVLVRRIFLKRNMNKYKEFENVLTNSNYVRKSLLEYGFTGNIETIYHPVAPYFKKLQNRIEIRNELGLPNNKILLLSVSSNAMRKNLALIEKAMKILPDNFALVRVGVPVGNSITFPTVSNEKLNKIYNACDVILMPSIEEGLGLPIIEGFATGIPVVASDIEVFHEIGKDAVEYINPLDVQSLIDGIYNAVENKDKMISKADEIVPRFSFQIFKEKMLDYYKRIL